jgi:hypothetical protein
MFIFLGAVANQFLDPIQWLVAIPIAFAVRQYQLGLRVLGLVGLQLIILLMLTKILGFSDDTGPAIVVASSIRAVFLLLLIRPKFQYGSDTIKFCTTVGSELHRQIVDAFETNQKEAEVRLNDLTTTGYLFGFINEKTQTHADIEPTDELFAHIFEGILPNKLSLIFKRNHERLVLAKEVNGLEAEVANFDLGVSAGKSDAQKTSNYESPHNLNRYLTGQKFKLKLASN